MSAEKKVRITAVSDDSVSADNLEYIRKPETHSPASVEDFYKDVSHKAEASPEASLHTKTTGLLGPELCGITDSTRLDSIIIAIGASTGGTEATLTVLKRLPRNTPGIVVVQHMPPGFTKMYADRLDRICQMEVKEAQSGDRITKGRVLIAPGDLQMKVVRVGSIYTVNCVKGEKVSGHCPSVDVLFDSTAKSVGKDAVGIIMTGMGSDGANGLLQMRRAGAFTIGQDEKSCVVYGMPAVAWDIGAVAVQTPCEKIAETLAGHLNKYSRS